MQINLFSSQTFQAIKQTANRFLTPQQQRICAVAMLAFSCLAMVSSALLLLSKVIKMHFYDPEFEKGLNAWIELEKGLNTWPELEKESAYKAAKKIREAYYNKSDSLDLKGYYLNSLPPEISNLVNLTVLNLCANQLRTVPESIGNLVNLTVLYLSHNKLETVPESIRQSCEFNHA